MRTLAIAAVQTKPEPGDTERTWQRYAGQVHAIRHMFPHVQMVIHPELHLSAPDGLLAEHPGYSAQAAVPLPGPLTRQLGKLARETGLWLIPGTVYERGANGHVHNTALVVGPDGALVTRYRKCFPWQPYEQTAPGTDLVTFDLPLSDGRSARIGLAICYDGAFPEVFRQLAWYGAEIVIQPTLTATRDRDLELVFARANAAANQMYVVGVNAADPHGTGESVIVDPEGIIRQQARGGEEILVDVLDLDAVTRVREFGTLGLNRPWEQLDKHGPVMRLPMYGGMRPRPPQ